MKRARAVVAVFLSGLICISAVVGQRERDPLSSGEVAQLRDQAQDPDLRLKLFVQFARQRLDAIEKLRTDPKATDRGAGIHDALQNFLDVYDEMNDNVDSFDDEKQDFRKALKLIIEADVEFDAKLRALQNSADSSKNDAKVYEFVLQTAVETVDDSAKDHRDILVEQEEAAKHKKKSNRK
ncbi:MAG: hypothetical protein ACRD2U_11405 [Terriglobales bacterium]